jgi:hypothetical protein
MGPALLLAFVCTLDRAVLVPYDHPSSATEEEWRDSRRAVFDFTDCDPDAIDAASRRVFFDVVRAEFETDHTAELNRWEEKRPGSEALFEGILIFQHRLRELMDRIVVPADAELAGTILAYGDAKAIAGLGPSVRSDVLRQLGKPARTYGISKQYDAQLEALGALGYWIDPANGSFPAAEKQAFVTILTSLLETSDMVRSAQHARVLDAGVGSLRRPCCGATCTAVDGQADRPNAAAVRRRDGDGEGHRGEGRGSKRRLKVTRRRLAR